MSSRNIPDDELLRMAVFRLDETARRMRRLAGKAETPRLRQVLTATSTALNKHAEKLLVSVEKLAREPLTPPARRTP